MATELEKLSKRSKHAIKFLAAEFKFVGELGEELSKIEREEPKSAVRDAKQMLRTYRWVAKSGYEAARDEDAILSLLRGDLVKILPAPERENADHHREQLKIANDILKKAISFYTGELKKDIVQVKNDEALIVRLEKDPKHGDATKLKTRLESDLVQLKEALKELEEWVSSNTTIVANIYKWAQDLKEYAERRAA